MSHPAASIKSIYSGKLNVDTPEMLDLEYEDSTAGSSEDLTSNLSHNSTTSCLSTTATKDGIEGRKIHHKANMMSHLISRMEDAEKYNIMLEKQDRDGLTTPDSVKSGSWKEQPDNSITATPTAVSPSSVTSEVALAPLVAPELLSPNDNTTAALKSKLSLS